jgi:hypothetical protein
MARLGEKWVGWSFGGSKIRPRQDKRKRIDYTGPSPSRGHHRLLAPAAAAGRSASRMPHPAL